MPASVPPVENILADLIRLRTENPPGGETVEAHYLKDLFARFGVDGEIVEPKPGRGSFIASMGQGERSLLFLSHSDVVPAMGGWDFDPFGGEISGGYVRGRGAIDCKSLTACQIYAALQLLSTGRLGGRLILAATADEEMGGMLGVEHLVAHRPELLRADFTVNEGGAEPLELGGRTTYFIQVGEKGTAWSYLRTGGVSCHGSVPHLGDNAVARMAAAVARIAAFQPSVVLIPEVATLISSLARLQGVPGEVTPETVDRVVEAFSGRAFVAYLKAISRMTLSPNVIQGGYKTNVVPDECRAEVDVRVLPGQDRDMVLGLLQELAGEGIDIDLPNFQTPTFSTSQSPHYQLLRDTLVEVAGDVECLPCLSAGATDSRFLRRVGIPAYGVSVFAPGFDQSLRETMHGRNERIDIASLHLEAEFLVRLASRYLSS
jgi:acetylornithine deacetylase/succinyl-diaminopimelate desuccinylase-like protein